MPVKHDGSRRWVEMEVLVPGTPEQVWHAIATGPGMTAWFTGTKVDEKVGGKIEFDFGDGVTSAGTVTEWDPPHRFGYEERDWNGSAPPVATEVVVTSRSGDRCVVRMVHSLFASDEQWDDQLESFESGWPGFFEVLRVYLARFAGKPARVFRTTVTWPGSESDSWSMLSTGLDLAGANVGDRREAPPGAPRFAGVVERIEQNAKSREMMLRLDEPSEGVALLASYRWDDKTQAMVSMYLYGEDGVAAADRVKGEWTAWIRDRFAAAKGITA